MMGEGCGPAEQGLPADLDLVACDVQTDGPFIRALTRANFYESISRTFGWDEARFQQEPHDPERYTMVRRGGQTVGFFALREDGDALYLQTLQLVAPARGQGVGTALLRYIVALARARQLPRVRLRVFRDNRAITLYERHGFHVVDATAPQLVMERNLRVPSEEEIP